MGIVLLRYSHVDSVTVPVEESLNLIRLGCCHNDRLNGTVRDNIMMLGALEGSEDEYTECVAASCLLPDLAQLTNGDGTLIGERGVTLSGKLNIQMRL